MLRLKHGPKLDRTTVHAVKTGQITVVPPATAHYEGAKTTTVVVVSGDGPLITTWIKPT